MTVSVGGKNYTGDGRVSMQGAMFSATRAALKALGLRYEVHISNATVQSDLERFCETMQWNQPKYTFEPCRFDPQREGRRQQQCLRGLFSVAVSIGKDRFVGNPTFDAEQGMVDVSLKALKEIGYDQRIIGNEQVFQELLSFCQLQGLGKPTYSVYIGNSIPDRVPIVPAHESQCVQVNGRLHNRDSLPDNGGYVRGRRDRAPWCSEELPENDLGCSRNEGSEIFVASRQYSRRAMQVVNTTHRYYHRNTNANGRARMRVQRSCRLPAVV